METRPREPESTTRRRPARVLLLAVPLCALFLAAGEPPEGEPPVAVYAELDGTWEGTFAGYDAEGRELYRISVRQQYRTVDGERQEVRIEDRLEDGTVITGHGFNTARRLADGSLELRCVVEKSNGDRVEHQGRLGRTPDGLPQLVWFSEAGDRIEVFREVVRQTAEGPVYTIDGVGRYGGSLIVMAGRYRKVAERPGPR